MRLLSKFMASGLMVMASVAAGQAADQVTLRFSTYADDSRIGGVNKIIEAFEKANPGIKIAVERSSWEGHWQKKLAETASNTLPDVWEFVPGFGAKWMATDQLLDLKPFMDKDAAIDAADFDQGMLDYFRKNGGIYGFPYDRSAYEVFFNKDLFDKAGVPYPKAGWTYADFTAAAAAISKLSDGTTKYFGLSQPPDASALWGWDGIYRGFGAALIGDDGKMNVNNEDGVAALTEFNNLVKDGYAPQPEPSATDVGSDTIFLGGKAGMQISGGWTISHILNAKINAGVAPMPMGPKGQSGVKLGGAFVVSKSTEHPNEAYKFIAFLTSSQGLTWYITDQHSGVPARQSSGKTLDPLTLEYVDGMSGYAAINAVENAFAVFDAQKKLYEQMWTGGLTPEQVAEQLQQEGDRLLK